MDGPVASNKLCYRERVANPKCFMTLASFLPFFVPSFFALCLTWIPGPSPLWTKAKGKWQRACKWHNKEPTTEDKSTSAMLHARDHSHSSFVTVQCATAELEARCTTVQWDSVLLVVACRNTEQLYLGWLYTHKAWNRLLYKCSKVS